MLLNLRNFIQYKRDKQPNSKFLTDIKAIGISKKYYIKDYSIISILSDLKKKKNLRFF